MEYDMIIYESEAARQRNPADTERFDRSWDALKAAGIEVSRVLCDSADDIDEGEAAEIVRAKGLGELPICLYQFAQPIQVVLLAQDVLDGCETLI